MSGRRRCGPCVRVADQDAWLLLLAPADAGRLVDQNAAVNMRAGADGDIAIHGSNTAMNIGLINQDFAIDRAQFFALEFGQFADGDRAIVGFDITRHTCLFAQLDRAVDGTGAA